MLAGDFEKVHIEHAEFNVWAFPTVRKSDLVKLPEGSERVNAFPMELNPDFYENLMLFLCERGDSAVHIHANVCQSLLVANRNNIKIHCWERDESMASSGIDHAADIAATEVAVKAIAQKVTFYLLLDTV